MAQMQETLLGRSIFDFYGDEALAKKIGNAFDLVERTGESQMLEHPYPDAEGLKEYEARIVLRGDGNFLIILRDITQQKKAEENLYIRNRALESAKNGIIIVDVNEADHPIIYANAAFSEITGYHIEDITGKNCRFLQADDRDQKEIAAMREAVEKGEPCTVVLRNYKKDGTLFWNEISITPILNDDDKVSHFIGIQNDVTQRKQEEIRDERSTKILEMVAMRQRLPAIAEFLVRTVETLAPHLKASILRLDQAQGTLHSLAAPHLPKAYSESIEGVAIGPKVGSCGTAAFTKKEVLVTDIATDPLWHDFKHLIVPHGLNSCWSMPIFSSDGSVLGTFALYSETPITPTKEGRERLLNTCKMISIAMEQEQADANLKESNRRYRQLIDNLPGVIYRSVPDDYWTMLFIGQQIEELTGYPPEDFMNANEKFSFSSIMHPDDREPVRKLVMDALEKRGTYELVYRIKTKSGQEKWLMATGSGVFSKEGELLFLEGFAMDKTENIKAQQILKQSEEMLRDYAQELEDKVQDRTNKITETVNQLKATNEQLERQVQETKLAENRALANQALYLAIAEHFPNGIIVVADKDFRLVSVQGEDLDVLEMEKEQINGLLVDDVVLFSEERKKRIKQNIEDTLAGNHLGFEVEFKGINYTVNSMPLFEGPDGAEQALFVYTNISQQKEVEHEIKKALEKEKELSELKSRFVSMASHEFRTPLATILSSATLIGKQNGVGLEAKREKYVEGIKTNVRSLVGILNDFLSLGKLEEGKTALTPEPFDILYFSKELLSEVEYQTKKGQTINLVSEFPEIEVVQDQKLLRHILLNLLTNAMKYSEENKEIIVDIQKEQQKIILKVTDQGIGIPEEEQANMFERFFRARNATNIQGTGLGLHIVKKYVELMGGSIRFESELYEGTTFTVSLPVKQEIQEVEHF